MQSRRAFLSSLPLLGLAPLALSRPKPGRTGRLRLLVLGGTNCVGPHLVRTAIERGHEVTLFNRGITSPRMFPELETLLGDRYPDRGRGPAAPATPRTWDAVVDTWQEAPGCVDLTARMLARRAARYLSVSSIATYLNSHKRRMTEEGPLFDAAEHVGSFEADLGYVTRKRASEQAVERHFGERRILLRCTRVHGLNLDPDPHNQGSYWPSRFLSGQPILAPDDPLARFQLIDVRDLARFAVNALENGFGGAFNVAGPEEPLLLRDYPLAWSGATIGDVIASFRDPTALRFWGGMSRERELALLAGWKAHAAGRAPG
jgi:2'-hydroxyisoflavone reductase